MVPFLSDPGVLGKPSCGEGRNVSGIEGGDVMLPLDDVTLPVDDVTLPMDDNRITEISWVTDRRVIAGTELGKAVVIREKLYKGRVNVTADGSLIIYNLSREDQRMYTADIHRQLSGHCTQIYHLRVDSRKTNNTPPTQSNANQGSISETSLLIICVVLSVLLLVIFTIVLVLKCHPKPSPAITSSHPQHDTGAEESSEHCVIWKENEVYSYLDIQQKDSTSSMINRKRCCDLHVHDSCL